MSFSWSSHYLHSYLLVVTYHILTLEMYSEAQLSAGRLRPQNICQSVCSITDSNSEEQRHVGKGTVSHTGANCAVCYGWHNIVLYTILYTIQYTSIITTYYIEM
jgi:hypothetical protein